jgi:CRP-like cAMP-binding protein
MTKIMSSELDSLLRGLRGREWAFEPGASVFHLGDPVQVMYFVRRGAIHLMRRQQDGAALILQRARADSILAEASLYSDRYYCDAVSESDAGHMGRCAKGRAPTPGRKPRTRSQLGVSPGA